jgi:folate-binding protein YgfZ
MATSPATTVSTPAAFQRTDRVFLRASGRDPGKMVQGLITNDLGLAGAARAVYAGLLTPKGKLVAELRVFRRADEIWLETAVTALENVLAHFRKFVPPLFARFEVNDRFSLLGVYGPGSSQVMANLLGVVPPAREDELVAAGPVTVIRTHYAGPEGFDLLIEGDAAPITAALHAAGVLVADADRLEPMRIEAGTPAWGAELDESVIPLEAGLRERMISETKGCYTGQEVIIRILHRGHVNWLLRGMLLGEVAPPARGTPLFGADQAKQMGRVTSACQSERFGEVIALGYARRELPLPARLHLGEAGGPPVTIVELPFATAAAVRSNGADQNG